jgi:predicted anti-sigma-YlaC factor YlaD
MDGPADIRCHQIVELVTDYLEGKLDDATRTRFELHVVACRGCEIYLDQMAETAAAAGAVPQEEPEPEQVDELLQAFRSWHRKTLEER